MYIDCFEENRRDNIGLLLHGNVGSIEAHLAATIINEIMFKYDITCKMRNFF